MNRNPTRRLQRDPPEGARETVEHELNRQRKGASPEPARKTRAISGGSRRKPRDKS